MSGETAPASTFMEVRGTKIVTASMATDSTTKTGMVAAHIALCVMTVPDAELPCYTSDWYNYIYLTTEL